MNGSVDELPVGGRRVRLAADQVLSRRIGGHCRDRDDQIAQLQIRLETAAGADTEEPLDAELHEFLEHDRRRRAAHPGRLNRDRPALELAGVAEHAALAVPLDRVVEVGIGDVLRPQRVAGEQARLGVVAGLGADVDRHGATLCAAP